MIFGFRTFSSSPKVPLSSFAVNPCSPPHPPVLAKPEPGIYLSQSWPQPWAGTGPPYSLITEVITSTTNAIGHGCCNHSKWSELPSTEAQPVPCPGRIPVPAELEGLQARMLQTPTVPTSSSAAFKHKCFTDCCSQLFWGKGFVDFLIQPLTRSLTFICFFSSMISMASWLELCNLLLSLFILASSTVSSALYRLQDGR